MADPTTNDLCEQVEKLRPLLLEHAAAAEDDKRLARPALEALREAGLFRMFRPRARGGLELDPSSEFRVAEAVARIDSAAAWNVQVSNASELFGGWFSDAASEEVYGESSAIVAGSFNPHRRAVPCPGGFRVTGRTPFNSNCHGATWLIGLADVYDGDAMRVDAEGQPETLLTAIPAHECRIIENWNTMGMGGTGSHDVEVVDLFVPSDRAVPFGPLAEPSPAYATPLTPLAMWATVGCHASVALGIGQAAVDELRELGSKVPAYTERALRDRSTVQLRLARAEGTLAAARAFFHAAYDEAWAAASANGCLEMDEKARCQLASSNVVLAASEAVDLVHSCVGTAGIRDEQRFQKHFRDVHVITQHAFVCETRLEAVGQIMLGLEPDWGFFAF
jgi:alkylation response protein AidB-like acyl-CoA dehydrogenase